VETVGLVGCKLKTVGIEVAVNYNSRDLYKFGSWEQFSTQQ